MNSTPESDASGTRKLDVQCSLCENAAVGSFISTVTGQRIYRCGECMPSHEAMAWANAQSTHKLAWQ